MFIDYYKILEIDMSASASEVKSAYRKQAMKWHPDTNPGVNTNDRMLLIIEAHLILKDPEARKRYDKEYLIYFAQEEKTRSEHQKSNHNADHSDREKSNQQEYKFSDEVLKRWMENASKQAATYLAQTIDDFKELTVVGATTFVKELIPRIISGIVILTLIAFISRGCN